MKIAVIGSGAIGALVAAYLKEKKEDVFLVGRQASCQAIRENGLEIVGCRGDLNIKIEAFERLEQRVDLVILAVKTQDIEEAIKQNLSLLKGTTILATQNGVQAENILSQFFPQEDIISSIVMFGSTYLWPGKIAHNFEGKWIIGRRNGKNDSKVSQIVKVLEKAFPVVITENITGMKYLKIFVNANNCLAAILGESMQEAFKNLEICGLSILIWKEGLNIVDKSKINLESLPDFPAERVRGLVSLPLDQAAKIFSQVMLNLSKEPLYGSVLQSIQRNRPSEIDYLNGEFLRLAAAINEKAPLNERLVSLVHQVEQTKKFLKAEELLNLTKEVCQ